MSATGKEGATERFVISDTRDPLLCLLPRIFKPSPAMEWLERNAAAIDAAYDDMIREDCRG